MTREQEFLLTVLQKAVRGEAVQTLPDQLQWDELVREAKDHAVWLLVHDALSGLQQTLPNELQEAELDAMSQFASNYYVELAQAELTQVLEQMDCPYVIMKGLSAAVWYPKMQTRLLGDVDFMIPTDRMEEVAGQMKQRGYTHTCIQGHYHQNLKKDNICLEMHERIAGMPVGEDREKVQKYLDLIYEQRQHLQTDIDSFYVPGDGHQAVIQLLHVQNHITSGGIGLRHVMDWACFVNGTAGKPFWEEQVLPLMKKIGLFHFAAVLTKMSAIYLGSTCPDWASYVDETLCADFMEDVLTGGNFGSKDLRRNHCFGMFPDWKNQDLREGKLKRLYRSLHQLVLKQNPKAEGKPLLTGLLMVMKALRYIGLYLVGKRPNLEEVAVLAQQRETVYSRLRMFEKGD